MTAGQIVIEGSADHHGRLNVRYIPLGAIGKMYGVDITYGREGPIILFSRGPAKNNST